MMRLFNAIIFSNIWISLGAVGTTTAYYLFSKSDINYYYLILVFFSTLFAYNFQYLNPQNANSDRLTQTEWISNNLTFLKFLTFFSFGISSLLAIFLFSFKIWALSVPVLFFVIFYRKGKLNKFSIRNIPLIKIIIISICWMWSCSVVPSLLVSNLVFWEQSIFVFFYVFAITLPFDIRDYYFDNKSIITIPHTIGINATYILSVSILLLLIFISNHYLVLFILLTIILLLPSFKLRNEYYYLFILDGLLLVFPIFVK